MKNQFLESYTRRINFFKRFRPTSSDNLNLKNLFAGKELGKGRNWEREGTGKGKEKRRRRKLRGRAWVTNYEMFY